MGANATVRGRQADRRHRDAFEWLCGTGRRGDARHIADTVPPTRLRRDVDAAIRIQTGAARGCKTRPRVYSRTVRASDGDAARLNLCATITPSSAVPPPST